MTKLWKSAARCILHSMGGLAMLRAARRSQFRVIMFHSFRAGDAGNLDSLCAHIASCFEPLSLSRIIAAERSGQTLPANALSVTVDDGYRSYLEYAHPIFKHYGIPVTVYVVSDFSEGKLWLWPDQVAFAFEHTPLNSLQLQMQSGQAFEFDLSVGDSRAEAANAVTEHLKLMDNRQRLDFMARLSTVFHVEIPAEAPHECSAMNWDEVRAVASDGVEIGCHTKTHPIVSRLASASELTQEILGAKEAIEARLHQPVSHFCYPNGRSIDIGQQAQQAVKDAGFSSAATTFWGLNDRQADPMQLRRLPFAGDTEPQYGAELLAGLHLPQNVITNSGAGPL